MDDIWLSKELPTHWAARVLSESAGAVAPIDGPGVLGHLSYAPFTVDQDEDDLRVTWEMASPPEPIGADARFDLTMLKATHALAIAHSDSGDPMMTLVACWSTSEDPRLVVVMEHDAEPPVFDDRGSLSWWVSALVDAAITNTDGFELPKAIEARLRQRVTAIAKARLAAGAFIPPSWRALPEVPDEPESPADASGGNEVDQLFTQLDDAELGTTAEALLHQHLTFASKAKDVEAFLDSLERAAETGGFKGVVAYELLETTTTPAFGRNDSYKSIRKWPAKIQQRVLARIERGIADDDPDIRSAAIEAGAAIDVRVDPAVSPLRLLYAAGVERAARVRYNDKKAVGVKQGGGMDELLMRMVLLARHPSETGYEAHEAAATLWKLHPEAFWGRIRVQVSGGLLVATKAGSIPKWMQGRLIRAIHGEEPRSVYAARSILSARRGSPTPPSVKKALRTTMAENPRVSRLLMYLSVFGVDDAEPVVRACYDGADEAGRTEVLRLLTLRWTEPPWFATFREDCA